MRTITLQMNFRGTDDWNWSVKTEVLVEDDSEAEEAGRKAASFIYRFQNGMIGGFGPEDE